MRSEINVSQRPRSKGPARVKFAELLPHRHRSLLCDVFRFFAICHEGVGVGVEFSFVCHEESHELLCGGLTHSNTSRTSTGMQPRDMFELRRYGLIIR